MIEKVNKQYRNDTLAQFLVVYDADFWTKAVIKMAGGASKKLKVLLSAELPTYQGDNVRSMRVNRVFTPSDIVRKLNSSFDIASRSQSLPFTHTASADNMKVRYSRAKITFELMTEPQLFSELEA